MSMVATASKKASQIARAKLRASIMSKVVESVWPLDSHIQDAAIRSLRVGKAQGVKIPISGIVFVTDYNAAAAFSFKGTFNKAVESLTATFKNLGGVYL